MSKSDKDRLKALDKAWTQDDGLLGLRKMPLTLYDLRLMLESYEPMRKLVRDIAGSQSHVADNDTRYSQISQERDDAKSKLVSVQRELLQLRDDFAVSEKQLRVLREQQSITLPELMKLREDKELAERLGLIDLPGDAMMALIQAVSVLSQLSTVERLWEFLKERCDREKRPVSEDESSLLTSALSWHNFNWRRKPYQLVYPKLGNSFDFVCQLRAVSTPSGEIIAALWLPGLTDHSGKVLKKALVSTR